MWTCELTGSVVVEPAHDVVNFANSRNVKVAVAVKVSNSDVKPTREPDL